MKDGQQNVFVGTVGTVKTVGTVVPLLLLMLVFVGDGGGLCGISLNDGFVLCCWCLCCAFVVVDAGGCSCWWLLMLLVRGSCGAELTRLDRIVGDGDCGHTFKRGALAILEDVASYPVDSPALLCTALGDSIRKSMGKCRVSICGAGCIWGWWVVQAGASCCCLHG